MWLIGTWVFPVISAGTWLGMLLAMLIRWCVIGKPQYPSFDPGQTIAYISDVGAFGLKPLFISGCCVTTVFLDLAFASERFLRHEGRLAPNTSRAQVILSVISILFAVCGTVGLVCLSIFDTYHYPNVHDGCLLLFIGGYVLSAIFACAEYQRLGIRYRNHRIIRISFWVKLVFILVEIAFAAVFIGCDFDGHPNIAAIFEWMVAFVFTFYVLSFLLDLLPAVRTKHHLPQGFEDTHPEMTKTGTGAGNMTHAGAGEYEQPLTLDSAGPNDHINGGYRGTATSGHPHLAGTVTGANGHAGTGTGTNGYTGNGPTNGYTNGAPHYYKESTVGQPGQAY